jgi:hypothetical protein
LFWKVEDFFALVLLPLLLDLGFVSTIPKKKRSNAHFILSLSVLKWPYAIGIEEIHIHKGFYVLVVTAKQQKKMLFLFFFHFTSFSLYFSKSYRLALPPVLKCSECFIRSHVSQPTEKAYDADNISD